MKRFLKIGISIAFLMATTQVMWGEIPVYEMNLYATKLQPTSIVDRETRQVDLYFGINTDTKGVWIYLDQNNDKNYTDGELIYGNADKEGKRETSYMEINNCTIPSDLPGGTYGWAVKVKSGTSNTAATQEIPSLARAWGNATNRYKFQHPKALAINTYTESEYCGYSYVGEAGNLTNLPTLNNDDRLYRTGSSQGVYVFGPSLGVYWSSQNQEELTKEPYGAFTGGVNWWNYNILGYYYGPYRVSTDKDGYVYMCQNHKTYYPDDNEIEERVWRVHASQLTNANAPQFTCILKTKQLYESNTSFGVNEIPKRVLSMSVGQEGEQKVLYVISGYTQAQKIEDGRVFLTSWQINENGDGTCTLSPTGRCLCLNNIPYGNNAQSLLHEECSVVPGNENGDLWVFQKILAGNQANNLFTALHLSPSGNNTWVADYRIPSEDYVNIGGTGAIGKYYSQGTYEENGKTHDINYHLLSIPTMYKMENGNYGYSVNVFRIFKNPANNNILKRGLLYRIKTDGANAFTDLDAVAFDIADNLYFTARTQEGPKYLYVFAIPKQDDSFLTPASNAAALSVPYKVTWNSSETGYTIQDGVYNTTKNSFYPYLYNTDELPTLSKKGYVFEGWYDNAQFTPLQYIDQDITLYAKWTEIKINEGTNVDNEPIIDLVKDQTVSMKVSRKLQGDMFSTLCLPFAVDHEILNSAIWDDGSEGYPLKDATLWTFSGVTSDEETNTKTLVFTNTNEKIPAYTPFLILPKNDVAKDIFFHDVEISMPDNLEETGTVTNNDITFHGAINPVELPSNAFFLVADNRLAVSSQGGATLPALRGYFTAPSGSKLQIRTQQGTTTLLDNINSEMKNAYKILQDGNIYIIRDNRVYDLKGQVVSDRL